LPRQYLSAPTPESMKRVGVDEIADEL